MAKHRHIWHENVDHEDYFTNLMTQVLPKAVGAQINCINLGKVTYYNERKHVADVQLLPLQMDGQKMGIITNAIVPSSIYTMEKFRRKVADKLNIDVDKLMKVGAVVCVGFFDREIDNYHENNRNYKIESDRMHSLNDAIILGVIEA